MSPSSSTKKRHVDSVLSLAIRGQRSSAIASSWKRCLDVHRLDPERQGTVQVLTQKELKDVIDPIDQLVKLSDHILLDLYREVAPAGYMVMLTDPSGVAVTSKAFGDTSPFGRWGLCTGAVWSEACEGTNGVGVCLTERRPITVHADEHFKADYIGLSCTVAPIFDHTGRLVAGLDISCCNPRLSQEVIGFAQSAVNRAAARLEADLFRYEFRREWICAIGETNEGQALVSFDRDQRVIGANRIAKCLIGLDEEAIRKGIRIIERRIADFPLDRGAVAEDLESRRVLQVERTSMFEPPVESRPAPATHLRQMSLMKCEAVSRPLERAVASARAGVPIMLLGETGSGKEHTAALLHSLVTQGHREPFVKVDCDFLMDEDYCASLFGGQAARSAVVNPDLQGTLYLDRVDKLPLWAQGRLLQVLEHMSHISGPSSRRIISSATSDIEQMVAGGDLRSDLYYLIRGASVQIPPLREREDKQDLMRDILASIDPSARLDAAANDALMTYHWPGNVRELVTVLRVAAASCRDGVIRPIDLDVPVATNCGLPGPQVSEQSLEDAEKAIILSHLAQNEYDVERAAKSLRMSRATIYRKMQKHQIDVSSRLKRRG